MAGFFSLGASASTNLYSPPSNNLFHHQVAQEEPNNRNNSQFPTSILGFGVGPTSKLSDDHQQSQVPLSMMMMRSAPSGVQGSSYSNGDGSRRVSINCQDCGNQAKKECVHMRCRTCCKSRGFQCQTHVKSTWVPAAKRREKQQQQHQLQHKRLCHSDRHQPNSTTAAAAASNSSLGCSTSSTRLAPSPSAQASGKGGGGTLEVVKSRLPPEVRSTAVFKCVKVSPIDHKGDDIGQLEQVAYQTSINIGGHLFKGILYDQGPQEYNQQQQQQQSYYCPDLALQNINQHFITNTQHGTYSFDTTRMSNAYQNARADPISFPGASSGTHFFP